MILVKAIINIRYFLQFLQYLSMKEVMYRLGSVNTLTKYTFVQRFINYQVQFDIEQVKELKKTIIQQIAFTYFGLLNTAWLLILLCVLHGEVVYGQQKVEASKVSGFIDFNGYYDTREFSVLTYNILVNMPKRLQYFSLTNYQSSSKSADLNSNFAEHNLRWAIGNNIPLDLTVQYVLRNGDNNDDVRLGFRWRASQTKGLKKLFKKLNMSYSMNPMLVQFRKRNATKYATQIEHVYAFLIAPQIFRKRLYLGGFADQNIVYTGNGGVSFKWVSEHQLGFRIVNRLFAVLEYRINDYFLADNYGLGYGLEYKILF